MPRGGWRPGAGRKPVPKSKAEAKFSPETLTLLNLLKTVKNTDKLLELRLKRQGLTAPEFKKMLEEQKGRCALCNEPLSSGWVIDHCHLTMKVRALLHNKCNQMIGFANEDPLRLEQAIAYLKKHNKFL